MFALLALNLLVGGALAYLAGVVGLAQTRRLRRVGVSTSALVTRRASEDGPGRPLLQFATRDGLVLEVFSPVGASRAQPLTAGREVLVRYDPADPRQVVVQGRERTAIEYGFMVAGAVIVLTALTLAALAI
ncbi:DUF3592 domain-containing protein [Kitasatospora kifunensis]|uniref:DUF3592 domain-containing protein n=1 Tax=Kitasatospora kifunensis TaxID=58351 RepID=A0A7W7VYY7_KITKI|nr:DUF3592 domain-containing protein [Kitasatospora kifunensis]MBB4927135.1 hypothetical protein [Kitasatospora kifunensis]